MMEIRNLSKSFGKKQVLQQINLSLGNGIYGLLGPNGAGKTTLIRCITRVFNVPKDSIFVDGIDINKQSAYPSGLGYLPQKFGSFNGLTAAETLLYFAESKKIPKKEQKEDILRCLEAVGLTDRANDKIKTFSCGMVRRLGIAQAILGDPKWILFDEPTAGLDPEERLRFKNLIASLSKDKLVILSTHIVEDVVALCDHIVILTHGKIAATGTVSEIAALGEGHVFLVPAEQEQNLISPCFIAQKTDTSLRVISGIRQPGEPQPSSVEDGYLCVAKELL